MKAVQIKLKVKLGWNINANEQIGTRVTAKYLVKGDGLYPFISARNIRFGIRQKFLEKGYEIDWYRWEESKKELKDSADPIRFVDNDIFGYMYPIEDVGAIKRVSPVWVSPWLADEPVELSTDQGGKFPRKEGQPMLMENEIFPPVEGTVYFVITERIGKFDYYEVLSQETRKWIEYFIQKTGKKKENEKIEEAYRRIVGEDCIKKEEDFNNYISQQLVRKEDDYYLLVKDLQNRTREERIRDLFTIILKEGWIPARKAQYLYLPEYIKAEVYAVRGIKSFSILEKREEVKVVVDNNNDEKNFIEKIAEKKIVIDYKNDAENKIDSLINALTKFLL